MLETIMKLIFKNKCASCMAWRKQKTGEFRCMRMFHPKAAEKTKAWNSCENYKSVF